MWSAVHRTFGKGYWPSVSFCHGRQRYKLLVRVGISFLMDTRMYPSEILVIERVAIEFMWTELKPQ